MKRRLFSTLICIILALSAIFSISVAVVSANDSKPVISVNQTIAESGEEFNVSVSVSQNSGIAGIRFKLAFDGEVVTPVLDGELPVYSTDLDGVSSVNLADDKISYVWANGENFTTDGQIVFFKFKASEIAYAEIDFAIEAVSAYNADENGVQVTSANAKCIIVEGAKTGTQTSSENEGKYAVRFVGKIRTEIKDLLLEDANSFGFTIKFAGATETEFKTVECQSLMHVLTGSGSIAGGQDGVDGYEYFALTVNNVPVGFNSATYSVWFTINGTTFSYNAGTVSLAPIA